jgi:hypothetical protein
MPPLRAELSTVSIPPREKRLAKHRAKAIKLGLPPSALVRDTSKHIKKAATNMLTPTLASTRTRRAREFAYFSKPDGFYVKRVVRRPTQAPISHTPYLPGQEGELLFTTICNNLNVNKTITDIPHSDSESDTTDVTMLEVATGGFEDAENMDESIATEPNELDYDAEGEDDEDVAMECK